MNYVNKRGTPSLKLLCAAAIAMFLCLPPPTQAQAVNNGKNDAIYLYKGADRDQQLVKKARAEGTLNWYTSLSPKESVPMGEAFEKKYGIKVALWRSTSDKVIQRSIAEAQAGRHTADVIDTNGPAIESLAREKLLSEFYSPYLADLPANAIPAHRLWVADRLNFYVVAYNTNKFKPEDIPKHYDGFLNPKWKGQLGLEAADAEWMATIIKNLGTERGTKLFEGLAAMKPDVRKGHILLAEMVAAGEIPVALTALSANIESLKRRGAPIDLAPVEPVVARPQGIAVTKHAPHPHAALLFADFILSPEGQGLFNKMGRVPTSLKVKSSLNDFPYVMVDPATVLDETEKWDSLWNKLFLEK